MKALVISEDKELVKFYTNIFTENKIDVINYNWLLKAMDNVEEIKPDFIVVNSVEYPRHWKTLVQYVKSEIFIGPIFFVLQVNNNFSEDERKKAECLGINEIVSSFSEYFKKKITSRINELVEGSMQEESDRIELEKTAEQNEESESPSFEEAQTETISQESESTETESSQTSDDGLFSVDMIVNKAKKKSVECPGSYLLTNPVTGKVIYGKYLEYDGKKITCKVDNAEDFSGIENKSFIKYITFCNKKECKSFSANVNEYLDLAEQKFLVLDICDFYEEK